jgi:exopolysaccharide biosynthesis protein
LLLPLVALAEFPTPRPYPAVRYEHQEVKSPIPQKIFVAAIDLTNPSVQVRVARGGEDPDGDGEWQTTLMQPTKIADREKFDVVVNGDFFAAYNTKDAEGAAAQKQFVGGRPAKVIGPAVTDGKCWSDPEKPQAVFMIDGQGRPVVTELKTPPSNANQVIAGRFVLVRDGKNVAPPGEKPGFARGPHPRTAVGIRDEGKTLVMVVIDGRKKGEATGMSLQETGDVMIKLGCTDAVNLDGGGSSMLGIRNPDDGKMVIMNRPSDGRERSVANVLGVSVTPKKPGN